MLTGASAVIFDERGHVLLVKHTYGRLNWDLPGGHTDPGESAAETAQREVREETGCRVRVERLAGIYYEPAADMHHFLCACRRLDESEIPRPDQQEISECGFWALDALPRPISDFTIRRINEVLSEQPVVAVTIVPPRQWFD